MTIPASPTETGSNARELLFLCADDGASGLEAALFWALLKNTVGGETMGVMAVGYPAGDTISATENVTVGSSSTTVLSANSDRLWATFVNDSDETIYLMVGSAAEMNKGIRLNANGGSYEINMSNRTTLAIYAICSSGSKNLCVQEGAIA